MEEFEVSDDGVISFRARLPGPDYYRSHIKSNS